MSSPIKNLAHAKRLWPKVHILKVRIGKGIRPSPGDEWFYVPAGHPIVCTSERTFEVLGVIDPRDAPE
jgi:hypothetical protein